MKKAYNVYKIYGKTNIPKFLRDLSFMFLLGVCFLGFQTQTTAQAVFTSGPNGSNPGKIVEDASFLKELNTTTYSLSSEDAIAVLRSHKRDVLSLNHTDDAAELEQQATVLYLDSILGDMANNGTQLNDALTTAYSVLANSRFVAASNLVNPKSIADSVIDLLR